MTSQSHNIYQRSQLNVKIQNYHQDRLAIVCIRQSTLQQVERHGESNKLQYGLVDKAQALGWAKEQIDDDLGQSGSNAEGRPGFQRAGEPCLYSTPCYNFLLDLLLAQKVTG